MEHSEPSLSSSPQQQAVLPADPWDLALHARRGAASALAALSRLCQQGPPARRIAALRVLPGLLPMQPVWPILDALDRPGTPVSVLQALAEVRTLTEDPRCNERAFRAAQRALCQGFSLAEAARTGARRDHPAPRAAAAIASALYDYRFEWADGCIGQPDERHLREFLLSYAPRRLLIEPAQRARAPWALARHIAWLGRIGHLMPADTLRLARCCVALRAPYREAIGGAAQPGSVRAILAQAREAGLDLEEINRYVALGRLELDEEFAPVWLR